jgi:hypothetical protein
MALQLALMLQIKEKGELPRLKCFIHDLFNFYGVHETFKQKNTPVLKDEGGLNVFTTE